MGQIAEKEDALNGLTSLVTGSGRYQCVQELQEVTQKNETLQETVESLRLQLEEMQEKNKNFSKELVLAQETQSELMRQNKVAQKNVEAMKGKESDSKKLKEKIKALQAELRQLSYREREKERESSFRKEKEWIHEQIRRMESAIAQNQNDSNISYEQ